MPGTDADLLSVEEASHRLGVSTSTVWRLIRRGTLRSLLEGGRRYVPEDALEALAEDRVEDEVPPLMPAHPIFRLVGAGRGGGAAPGARDKHALLDE